MSFGHASWALVHLNGWAWLVAQYRGWLMALATVIGCAAPLLRAARKHLPRPAPSLVVRSGAMALALSAAAVAICSLLHFSDLRWLAPDQRRSLHLSAPSGLLGFTKPAVGVLNSVAGLPVEWRAAQVSVHTALVSALLAVAAFALALLTWRRARRADIRQIVQEEIRRATGGNRLCGTGPGCCELSFARGGSGDQQDRSESDCLWLFRLPLTCVFAGLYSAGAVVPPKQ